MEVNRMNAELRSELLQKAWEFHERREYTIIMEELGQNYIADLLQDLKDEAEQEWKDEMRNRKT